LAKCLSRKILKSNRKKIEMSISVRIDKFLWAVRLYKTRSLASDSCRMGRIMVNNAGIKPSRTISENDILTVKKPPVTFTYRVLATTENRLPAKMVQNYLEDITPAEEKEKLEMNRAIPAPSRQRGTGRPTKKERRDIDRWIDNSDL
jgi:ribosome-associated heat shock protein Hsp15